MGDGVGCIARNRGLCGDGPGGDRYLYVVSVLVILMGIVIHDPVFFSEYTDYLALYSRSPDRVLHGYPYADYEFEYTPIIAVLWLAASKIALLLSAYGYDPYSSILRSFYIINSIFYAAYAHLVHKISDRWGVPRILSLLSIASPSLIYYLFYNWDIIAALLMTLGVFLLARDRVYVSALLLGLGASVKIMPVFAIISAFIIIIMSRSAKKSVVFLLLSLSTAVLPFLVLFLIYPPGFLYFLNYHSQWYCENCFYILLTDNIYDQTLRTVSTLLMTLVPVIYTIVSRNRDPLGSRAFFMKISLLSVALSISFSYVYSPQMNIFLAPIYMFLSNRSKYLLLAQDILNTMIMVLWFHEKALSSLLGIESRGPWFRESPIQWIAFLRIILIWILAAVVRRK